MNYLIMEILHYAEMLSNADTSHVCVIILQITLYVVSLRGIAYLIHSKHRVCR